MKRTTMLALAILFPLLAACNTIEGLGQDVQKGGENLEDVAKENK